MIIQLPFNYELKLYINKLEVRTGICSNDNRELDKHCLLWDFDSTNLVNVKSTLKLLQSKFKLPDIYIVETSPRNYHAYSFTARTFMQVVHILSATTGIDMSYFKLGIVRGYFTLRISKRNNRKIKLVEVLKSNNPNEMNPLDLTVNEYMTSNRGENDNTASVETE